MKTEILNRDLDDLKEIVDVDLDSIIQAIDDMGRQAHKGGYICKHIYYRARVASVSLRLARDRMQDLIPVSHLVTGD